MTYESDITLEELARAAQSLKGRLMRNALWHVKVLDARSITVLQNNSLLRTRELLEISQYDLEVLLDLNHPARISVSLGPILVYYKEDDRSEAILWHVEDLLFCPTSEVRKSALRHFEEMGTADPPLLILSTRAVINRYRGDLQSEDPSRWRPAAVALCDSLRNDFFCNLAGVQQSFVLKINDMYTARILRPSELSLDNEDIRIWKASNKRAEIENRIQNLVAESTSLQEACGRYYREFGYIPLVESLSMVHLVDEWLQANGGSDNAWEEIWAWADGIHSPLPRYHACLVFARRPNLIPDGKLKYLWEEIAEVVQVSSTKSPDLSWSQAWLIRCELARHYTRYIESHFPAQDGELVASLSWWFAEQVSLLFGADSRIIKHIVRRVVVPVAERTSFIWQLAHPIIETCNLRYYTLYVSSIWSLCLLCALDKLLQNYSREPVTLSYILEIDKAMAQMAIETFPMQASTYDKSYYAFDQGLLQTAEAWLQVADKSDEFGLLYSLIGAIPKVNTADWITKVLKDLPNVDAGKQAMITSVLRMMVFSANPPTDTIWDLLSDVKWTKEILQKLDPNVLDTFFQALTELQAQNNGLWLTQVPHFFAHGCEETSNDRDRQKCLFGFTVVSAVNGGNTSAVRKLLRGRHKRRFKNDKDFWKRQFKAIRPFLPDWVAAKVRAVEASMHIR